MKKSALILFFSATLMCGSSTAQCTSYFQSLYNVSSGEMDFWQLCTYDTALHPVLFVWDFGDGMTSTLENPSHHYTSSNNFLVCLILYAGNGPGCCQDTFCEQVDFSATVIQKEPDWISSVSISTYEKNVSLHLTLSQPQALKMSLVTISGMVFPVRIAGAIAQGKNEIDFGMPDYPAGIYLLRIEDESGQSVAKRFLLY